MGHAPENTLSSFRKALELGVSCIELDVYFVDGHLIVFHDASLERTTDGHGYITEQTFDYLRSLDAGDGQQIPTLEEVCDVIEDYTTSRRAYQSKCQSKCQARPHVCLNIELKGLGTAVPVAKLISERIENGWHKEMFLVSSFHHSELLVFKRRCKDVKLGVLIRKNAIDALKVAEDLDAFSVNPSLQYVDGAFIAAAHAKGFKVFVYTVDMPQDIARMQSLGVDGVFTGYPERVLDNYSQDDATEGWC